MKLLDSLEYHRVMAVEHLIEGIPTQDIARYDGL